MRTIQMTLDDKLVNDVDKVVKRLKTSRSAFAQQALRDAINHANINRLGMKHKRGYERNPVKKSEFSIWESEQD